MKHSELEFQLQSLPEKLRANGSWDKVVIDSMDEYIDSLVDAGLSDIDADDLLQEEFF